MYNTSIVVYRLLMPSCTQETWEELLCNLFQKCSNERQERKEKEKERDNQSIIYDACQLLPSFNFSAIYIYINRERERERICSNSMIQATCARAEDRSSLLIIVSINSP
jgi:hypothetical protein